MVLSTTSLTIKPVLPSFLYLVPVLLPRCGHGGNGSGRSTCDPPHGLDSSQRLEKNAGEERHHD
jgi:hypothetical protein